MTRWHVQLTAAAESDFLAILAYTTAQFGEKQARNYQKAVMAALEELRQGPSVVGARSRPDIQPGLFCLHIALKGRRGRHFIMYRPQDKVIEVLRILHDAMDLRRHISDGDPS